MSEEKKTMDETVEENTAVAEEPVEETSEAQAEEQEDIQSLLEDARNKADDHWNQCLRLQAELDNTRRRAEQDVSKARKFALEKFAQELLPVKDSLEMGLAAAAGDDEALAKLREGTELTLKMLSGVLEKHGINEVDPLHQAFNPEWHQAMSMQESAEHEPNTVLAVMQKGYLLNERLVRPAMVVVSKAPAEG